MGSKDESIELSDVQKVLTSRKVNVTYLKKVKFEKGSQKYLAISTNRIFIIQAKSPHKIENSFHILDIQSIESVKPCVVQIKLQNEKQGFHITTSDQDQDSHFIVSHLVALLRYNFPGSYRDKSLKLVVEPADRAEKISRLSEALTSSTLDSEIGPCGLVYTRKKDSDPEDPSAISLHLHGGFSLSYASICDFYGQVPMAEVMWDIDKIYGSHGCKDFSILDFDHLEPKELIPVIATFEYNAWFKSFSCRSYRLGSDLVDVLAKVLKSNASIEELDLYDCHLQKESIQKLSQAISSNTKTCLKKLNLGKNAVDDKGINALCSALTSFPHGLESLQLKDVSLSAKGASLICSALKGNKFMSSTLTSLNFSSNPLKSDGASAICELLANSNVLRELDLSNADCALELVFGAIARGCLLHLKSLNLSGNPYSYRKAKDTQVAPSINKFFSSCMVLENINLSNTKISPEVVKAVLVGLIANTVVKDVSLDLSRNDLRSAGASEISSCIDGITNVTSLDLTDNGLDMDLVSLCQNFQKNKSLKKINLGQNIGKSKSIAVPLILESVAEMIMSETLPLTSLSLADCRLRQDAGIIIDSLGTNEMLQSFDISGNLIGDEGARLLAKALQINTKLRNINIDRNGITLKGFNDIATALERNYSLQLISTPFHDITQSFKNNGEGVTTCFKKIEQLLLRNQSTEHSDQEHSLKLKQNLLLNSLDQESTDYLLVKVQDSIDDLRDVEDDETVAKEVELGKEAIKDADKMKEVLFKMFVEIGNPSKLIEERTSKMTKEMIDFANELVKQNITGPLSNLKDQCPSVAENKETMAYIEKLISSKGLVDSLGVKETIARTAVGQISNKVTEATLQVASAFAEHLTNLMQESLTRSKIKLNFLSMEYKEKQKNDENKPKEGSLPSSPVDDKDASLLAAQKAKNRISTQGRHSKLLQEEGGKSSKGVKRRPTFIRSKEQDTGSFVEIEIPIDDEGPSEAAKTTEPVQPKIVVEPEPQKEVKQSDAEDKGKDAAKTALESGIDEANGAKLHDDAQDKQRTGSISMKAKGETKEDDKPKESLSTKVKEDDESTLRKGSFSLKAKTEKPKVDKKPRPKSSGALEIDLGTHSDRHLSESGLVHLNKGRAKPAKGRRPPSRAAGLAHLIIDESMNSEADLPSPESEEIKEESKPAKSELKTPPKPRPKSLQPSESPGIDHDSGVIRSGSIPHSASISMKPKPDVDSRPEIKKSPKPEPPKKENSIKKPRIPMGIPMPGMPGMPGLFKKDKSPSFKRKEENKDEGDKPEEDHVKKDEDKETKKEEDAEAETHQKEEPVPKPKPKYKPPGGVPFLGGAMGLGGQLMAEMKKKQNIKDTKEKPKETSEPEKTSPKAPMKVPRPSPGARKPPPPAKLSKEKRQSLIMDAGAKPILLDRPDGVSVTSKVEENQSKNDDVNKAVHSIDGTNEKVKEKTEGNKDEFQTENKQNAEMNVDLASNESKTGKSDQMKEGDKLNDSIDTTKGTESNNNNNNSSNNNAEVTEDSTL